MAKRTRKPRAIKSPVSDTIRARGFFKLQVGRTTRPDGKIEVLDGDSGWRKNTVVNLGFQDYLAASLGAVAGSKQITYAIIGTGTAPGATDTSLQGELTDAAGCRCAVTPTTIASKTVQFAFTLNSNVVTTSHVIQNVGLINTSTTNVGTIFAGNTYTTSNFNTNQVINGSYQIRFS